MNAISARSNGFDCARIGQASEHDPEPAGKNPAAPFPIRNAMDAIKARYLCQMETRRAKKCVKLPKLMAAAKKPQKEKYVKRHNDGSLWAKGTTVNGVPEGYWEWFRKDGTKLRSGHFENGKQTGEWITYDKNGKVYKVTNMR